MQYLACWCAIPTLKKLIDQAGQSRYPVTAAATLPSYCPSRKSLGYLEHPNTLATQERAFG